MKQYQQKKICVGANHPQIAGAEKALSKKTVKARSMDINDWYSIHSFDRVQTGIGLSYGTKEKRRMIEGKMPLPRIMPISAIPKKGFATEFKECFDTQVKRADNDKPV